MMYKLLLRFALLPAAAFLALASSAVAQTQSTADPERPVTPPDSYRVVMENERVRIIEVHIKAHSKVNVDSPAGRDRFLYMLSDGALVLAAPGKTPYEFALHAGETAVFPAISPVVENDTDSPVRALMVEIKDGGRTVASARLKGKYAGRHGARGKFAAKSLGNKSSGKSKSVKVAKATSSKSKQVAKVCRSSTPSAAASSVKPPLNLSKANAKPTKKAGRTRGSDS
jgi:quercetin dioxygenase-like cupin family protein